MPHKAALGKQTDELLAITHTCMASTMVWLSSDGKICALKWCVYKTPSCKSDHIIIAMYVHSYIAMYLYWRCNDTQFVCIDIILLATCVSQCSIRYHCLMYHNMVIYRLQYSPVTTSQTNALPRISMRGYTQKAAGCKPVQCCS